MVEDHERRDKTRPKHSSKRWIEQGNSRLRALGAAGLAAGLAASSHFDGCGWGGKVGVEKLMLRRRERLRMMDAESGWLFVMMLRDVVGSGGSARWWGTLWIKYLSA